MSIESFDLLLCYRKAVSTLKMLVGIEISTPIDAGVAEPQ